MPIEDPKTLLSQGEKALTQGNYEQARRMLRRARDAADSRNNGRSEAERYLQHLGEDNHAEVFQLQQQIASETDIDRKLELITEARERGLELLVTRPELPRLDKVFDQTQSDLLAQRESKALTLLEQAKESRQAENLERASTLCKEALQISPIGEELKAEIKDRLDEYEETQSKIHRREAIISEIRDLLDQSRYREALEQAQEALTDYPEDPLLLEQHGQAEAGANVVERIEKELLPQAERMEESDPQEALRLYEEAIKTAEAQNLHNLAEAAQAGKTRAQQVQEQKIEESKTLVEKAEAALAKEDFDTALDYYKQALEANPDNAEAEAGKERTAKRKRDFEQAKEWKEKGQERANQKNWAGALALFKKAQKYLPDDPELSRLIKEAKDNETEVRTVRDTIKVGGFNLQDEPVTTPDQFAEWLETNISNNTKLSQDEVSDLSEKAARAFAREAAVKLQSYLQPAENKIADGRFAKAQERCQDAYRQWKEYFDDNKGFIPDSSLVALESRLTILEAYRTDLKLAQETWESLKNAYTQSEQSLADGQYEDAIQVCSDVLQVLRDSPSKAHYILGKRDGDTFIGVWERARERFARAARLWAEEQGLSLRDATSRAESLLAQLNSEGAAEVLEEHVPVTLLNRLRSVEKEYKQLGEDKWPLSTQLIERVESLRETINNRIKIKNLYAEGRQFILEGNLDAAEQRFRQMEAIDEQSRDAKLGLQGVAHLRQLSELQQKAERNGDLEAEHKALKDLARLAPRWDWVSGRLRKVERLLERERSLDAWRNSARSYKRQSDPDAAKKWAEKVLKEAPDDEEMIKVISWAEAYKAGRRDRERWKDKAREAFQLGKFQDALDYADKVLQQDESDAEAQRLHERAEHAQDLYREATRLVHTEPLDQREEEKNLQKAEQKLQEIQFLGSIGGEWADLFDEVLNRLDDLRGLETRLEEIGEIVEEARDDEIQWLDVLEKTQRLHKRSPRAARYFRKARRAVRRMVRDAVAREDWDLTKRGLDALHRAGVDNQSTQKWDQQYKRADLMRRANMQIEQGITYDLDSLLIELENYLEKNALDREIRELKRKAEIIQLKHEAETAIQARDYETARNKLSRAIALNPPSTIRGDLKNQLDEVEIELALQAAKAKLKEGNQIRLEQAIKRLESVASLEDKRVTQLLQKARSIRNLLNEAEDLAIEGEIRAAIKKLDKVLHLQRRFQLASQRRDKLIEQQLEKAKQAEIQGDLWGARKAYETLEGIYPLEQTSYQSIKNQLNTLMNKLAHEASRALRDPDVQLAKIEGLLTDLRQIPSEIRTQRRTFNEYLPALQKLERKLRDVEDFLNQAESTLRTAHPIGQDGYNQVEHYLGRIREVDSRFAQRTAVCDLERTLQTHRERRHRVKAAYEEYCNLLTTWRQPISPVGADFAPPVRKFKQEGVRQLDQALELNKEIREKDEQNIYRIRPKSKSSEDDPLAEEHQSLLRQKNNLENIAEHLLEGISRRDEGDNHADFAQEIHDAATKDKDFKDAKAHWEQAVEAYTLALDSLNMTIQAEPLSERADALAYDAEQLLEKVSHCKEEAKGNVEAVSHKIEQLEDLRREAGQNYGDHLWMAALANYEAILDINPRDEKAQRKRSELKSKLRRKEEERKRQKKLLTSGIVGGLVGVALLVNGWYFLIGPGRPPKTPTITPTLPFTQEPAVVDEETTPTWTPETVDETITPEPSPSPSSQLELEMFDEPRKCTAVRDATVYQQPDQEASLGRTLNFGKGFDALGQTENEQWLFVDIVGYDETWILAEDAHCVP
jgi:tetratricopeptide (TPR) repeat protein